MFRAQADWTFILLSELPMKELCHLPRKMLLQAYRTSQYMVLRGSIFLGKWRSSFAGSSNGKMNVQLPCTLNTRYNEVLLSNQISKKQTTFINTLYSNATHHVNLMMNTITISKVSEFHSSLTQLIAGEDFIACIYC
jgi:hypothetical protein